MKELIKENLALALKRKIMDMCILPVLTYTAQTYSFETTCPAVETNIHVSKFRHEKVNSHGSVLLTVNYNVLTIIIFEPLTKLETIENLEANIQRILPKYSPDQISTSNFIDTKNIFLCFISN